MVDINEVLRRLDGVKPSKPGSWQCKCPHHYDKKASLTITQGDNKILFHCHAGCDATDILKDIDLAWPDLEEGMTAKKAFGSAPKWQEGLEALYDYYDGNGQYAYTKLRYAGKRIYYGYIENQDCKYKGITKERYLYNRKELRGAIEQNIPVYYVEGEKDVDTLQKLGLVATTAGGVGDWKRKFADEFNGAWVNILADNDEPGQELAKKVARDIKGKCYCYRIITPSELEKGDVTDYLQSGATKEQLLDMIETVPWTVKGRKKPKLKNLLVVEDAEIKWLWEPYMQADNLTIFRGDGGVGKTYFICALMSALSHDEATAFMPGILHRRGNSIYFGTEDDASTIKRRVRASGGNMECINVCDDAITMKDTEEIKELIKEANAKLIVFDPLQAYLGSNVDMNRANEIRPVLEGLRRVARDTDCAIVIIEHQNKMTSQSTLFRGVGSIDVVASARSVLASFFHPTNENERVTFQIKANARGGKPISWSIEEDGTFKWGGISSLALEEVEKITQKATGVKKEETKPAIVYVKAIMKKYPEGWNGRASKIFEEGSQLTDTSLGTPVAIGKQMNDENVIYALQKEGIFVSPYTKEGVKCYELYKHTVSEEKVVLT